MFHVEVIHLEQLVDHLRLIVRHPVMAHRLVEKSVKKIRRIPPLRPHHESRDIGKSGLQRHHHKVTHEANILAPWQIGLRRFIEGYLGQFALHRLQSIHLGLD